ncbi:hypothetical protein BDW60DRAFT_174924 [Aspergillus nidulans var. acristatus]
MKIVKSASSAAFCPRYMCLTLDALVIASIMYCTSLFLLAYLCSEKTSLLTSFALL